MIDPHHHLYDLDLNLYPWLQLETPPDIFVGDITPIMRSYLVDDLLADAAGLGLQKSVHVEVGWNPADPVGETRWLQGVADEHGFPHGIVGHARLHGDDVEAVIEGHCAFPNIRGIRHLVMAHDDARFNFAERPGLLTLPEWRKGFALLEPRELSFDLQVFPHQLADAADLAASFPGTQIVLDHAGMPLLAEEGDFELWQAGMRLLARNDNVAVKISGLGMVDHGWTVESIRPIVAATIDIFGTDRCMYASNFPVDSLYSDYGTLIRAFERIAIDLGLSASERDALCYGTAERVYRLA
jgi:predicted TIM-barrel fold metal-dependent hydrolase